MRLCGISLITIALNSSTPTAALTRSSYSSVQQVLRRSSSSALTSHSRLNYHHHRRAMSINLSSEEVVEIVDENNVVVAPVKRKEMRQQRLRHRATYAFVRDSDGYYYVQKRSKLKDYCPGFLDPTPGGVVAAGESYELTNRREVEEEMGIPSSTPMSHLFTLYYEDERIRCFGDAWELVYDGPLRLQEAEVESVHKMTMQEILSRYENEEKFTPDSLAFFYEYVKVKGMPPLPSVPPKPCTFY